MIINNKRFLITGGAGMIGSHIADKLLAMGAGEVVILDNLVRGGLHNIKEILTNPRLKFVKGDIRDSNLLMELTSGINGVFHMAALRITSCADDPRSAMEVMLTGTHNVFQASVEKKVERLVYASSASVYGMADIFPTVETHHPYNNRTYYGAAKIAGECMARSFADMFGMKYIALRYFNVYGPRMDIYGKYTEVLVRWIDRINAGLPPQIFGNGLQTVDMIHIDDVTDANILAIRSEINDEVFNVASGKEITLLALLETLLLIMGSPLKPEFCPARSVNPVQRRLADTRKADEMLSFKAEVDLESGLRSLLAWKKTL